MKDENMISAPELKTLKGFLRLPVVRATVQAAEQENYERRRVLAQEIAQRTAADAVAYADFFAASESADAAVREAQAELDLALEHRRRAYYDRTGYEIEANRYIANRRAALLESAPPEISELAAVLSRLMYRQLNGESDDIEARRNDAIRAALVRLESMKFEAAPHDDVRAELLAIRQSIPNFDALLLLTNYQTKE